MVSLPMNLAAAITTLVLLDSVLAARWGTPHRRLAGLGHMSLSTVPMHVYKEDCGLARPISALSHGTKAERSERNPGAGMDPASITPFARVLKDGYYEVECVRDYMFEYGDKFGDNRFSYALGDVSNVSIVLYTSHVPVTERQPMSHSTCFAFCRTVPEMLFFGIRNGRECYCAPYYKPMADDSSTCDAVCEGNPMTMCGGMTKSSMFAMHECLDTAAELAEASGRMESVNTAMTQLSTNLTSVSANIQSAATALQQSFGNAGDNAASTLMQSAKVFAGEMEASATSAGQLSTEIAALKSQEAGLAGSDFADSAVATQVEDLLRKMEKAALDGEVKTEEMQLLADKALPGTLPAGAAVQYYPVMYFVDQNKTNFPSTCGGDAAPYAMMGTVDECAARCDAKLGQCVGFSYFPHDSGDLCFLFSRFTSATYYTGCAGVGGSFLQRASAPANATECMAKLQHFTGTSLAPDASGKCEQCLKTVAEANRCFQ